MAKKNGNWWKIIASIGVIVGILGTAGAIVHSNGKQTRAVADTEKHVVELKEDGCEPANDGIIRITIVETEQKHLKEGLKKLEDGQTVMQETMKANQKEILKAVQEK